MGRQKRKIFFDAKGFLVIFSAFLCYWIGTCMGGAGMSNTVIPAFAAVRGFDPAVMMFWCSLAGWIGVPFVTVFAKLGERIGAKRIIVLTLSVSAFSAVLLGLAGRTSVWIAALVANSILASGYTYFAAPALIASWFPVKKGLALGVASMGIICCDLLWTPNIAEYIRVFGPSGCFLCIGGLLLLVALGIALLVRDTPEQAGSFPDNDPESAAHSALLARAGRTYQSDWTVRRLLRKKEVWLVGLAGGMLWIGSGGTLVSLYPRLLHLGYTEAFAAQVFRMAPLVALPSAWLLGWLDTRLGSKRTMFCFGCLVVLLQLCLALLAPIRSIWVYVAAIGMWACVGGVSNLICSIQVTIWGRWDYAASAKAVMPMVLLILDFVFIITSISTTYFGGWFFASAVMTALAVTGTILISRIDDTFVGKTDAEILSDLETPKRPEP